MSTPSAYSQAGVNIDRGMAAKARIKELVARTTTPEVVAGVGGFGALYAFAGYQQPLLVSSADSVGTKLMVAVQAGRFDTVGVDIVNHCVNDILTCGASPLFFLDYIAASRIEPDQVAQVVEGLAEACHDAGCALIGGETAELPGVYQEGQLDLAGFIVGVVEQDQAITGKEIVAGDVLLALPSSGLHTNGYSLVRQLFEGTSLDRWLPEFGHSLADELLTPHRSYLADVRLLRQRMAIKGLAHITGGGIIDNLPRILPPGLGAEVSFGSWEVPAIFRWLLARVDPLECFRVFNMGIGMLVVASRHEAERSGLTMVGRVTAEPGVRIENLPAASVGW
ncbi:MAG: phosphoribosylformylglycinamidine cyclo-ligase [Chloroflexota bacterium]